MISDNLFSVCHFYCLLFVYFSHVPLLSLKLDRLSLWLLYQHINNKKIELCFLYSLSEVVLGPLIIMSIFHCIIIIIINIIPYAFIRYIAHPLITVRITVVPP